MATFSWAAAEDVGTGLVGGLAKGLNALGAAKVAKSNARTAELNREGKNEVARSAASLANTVRNINNTRIMEAAGAQLDTLTQAATRTSDSFTRGKFEDSIKAAEQWGAATAAAAAHGIGGAGVRAIGMVNSLQIARRQQQAEEQGQNAVSAVAGQREGVATRALQSLRQGPILPSQDYSAQAAAPNANFAQYLLGGVLSKKDSLQTMLGSMYTQPNDVQPSPESAITTPVDRGSAVGTDLAPFQWDVSQYEDTTRRYNSYPPPYDDVQRMTNRSNTTRN